MILFNRKQLENIKMASKDETRLALNGLLIEGNSTIATDGHKLMKVTFTPGPLPPALIEKELGKEFVDNLEICERYALEKHNEAFAADWPANGISWVGSEKPFILARSTVEKAIKNIPKKSGVSNLPILQNVAIGLSEVKGSEPFKAVCQTTDLDNTDNVEARVIDARFPQYEKIVPDFTGSGDFQRVGVDAKHLKDICAQLEKYSDGSVKPIILYLKKDKLTCKILGGGKDNLEVGNSFLMPVIETEQGENCSMGITADDHEGTTATAVLMPVKL